VAGAQDASRNTIAAATIAMTVNQRMFVSNVTTGGYPLVAGGNNPQPPGFESAGARKNREPHDREE
jgi:hypothetical protein